MGPQEEKKKIDIWLDCDPGHDDAFAILLSTHHPSLSLLGVSTVHGNASLANTTQNTLSLLTLLSSHHIPVYPGASSGLVRPAVHAADIHGLSGLEGTSLLPQPSFSAIDGVDAIDAMATALFNTEKGTSWIVATGALTNVARCFEKYGERLADWVKGVSIMGGAIGNGFTDAKLGKVGGEERMGNWSAWAEFNVLVDPEAASFVLGMEGLKGKLVLMPLDVTHLVLATEDVQNLLLNGREGTGNGGSRLRRALVELLVFFASTYREVFGLEEGPPLHDPLAVAVVLDGVVGAEIPFYDYKEGEKGKRERYEVKVVTEGSHEDAQNGAETGRTIVRLLPEGEEGVKIPRGLNIERFWIVVEECLERADEANQAKGVE